VAASALVACGAERSAPVATPPPPPTTTATAERPAPRPVVTRRERTVRPPRTTVETTTTTTTPPAIAWDRFDEALAGRLIGSGDFAAAVAVAVDGEIVHTNAFGYRVPPPLAPPPALPDGSTTTASTVAPPPEPEPIEPGDRFRIGSISKVITAIVVLQMVEAGQLGLDDAVGGRLGAHVGATVSDPAVAAITVRQLLAHTSGLPGYNNAFFGGGADSCTTAAQQGLSRGLASAPGGYRYSNFNYCLLGLLVEEVAGRPYEAVVTDRLLAPLGIQGMRLARTFDDDPAQVVHPSAPLRNYMEVLGAAGSWVATPSDVVTILASLDPATPGWHPLSRPMLELMRQPQTMAYPSTGRWYGLGLMSFGDGSYGHTGTVENAHAMVVSRPDGVVWSVLVSGEYPWESNDLRAIFDRSIADAGIVLG
jgi:D-alanyl-D-alanine carboxypeptidase